MTDLTNKERAEALRRELSRTESLTSEHSVDGYLRKRISELALQNTQDRALNAAACMYAPTVWAVTVPGGVVLAWRTKIPFKRDVIAAAMRINRALDGDALRGEQ